MTLALLQPAGLLALGALIVPVALHLARRSEHHSIDFAALRFISARARPRRRVRIVERSLLLLRLLLIGALALLLAEPLLVADKALRSWAVVAPGVARSALPKVTSGDDKTTWRWLAPGFPPIDQPVSGQFVPVASLLRELDARLPPSTKLTVWVPFEMSGLDGASLEFKREVIWRVVPGRAPFTTPGVAAPNPFAVRRGADRREALRYLQAAWSAWSLDEGRATGLPQVGARVPRERRLSDVAESAAPPQTRGGALAWLRDGAMPVSIRSWVEAGGTVLIEPRTPWPQAPKTAAVVWRDERGSPVALASRLGLGRVVRLEAQLLADGSPVLRGSDFPRSLRELLYPAFVPADRALAQASAPFRKRAELDRDRPATPDGVPLAPWIALLVAALFVAERFVASSAHRWRST